MSENEVALLIMVLFIIVMFILIGKRQNRQKRKQAPLMADILKIPNDWQCDKHEHSWHKLTDVQYHTLAIISKYLPKPIYKLTFFIDWNAECHRRYGESYTPILIYTLSPENDTFKDKHTKFKIVILPTGKLLISHFSQALYEHGLSLDTRKIGVEDFQSSMNGILHNEMTYNVGLMTTRDEVTCGDN